MTNEEFETNAGPLQTLYRAQLGYLIKEEAQKRGIELTTNEHHALVDLAYKAARRATIGIPAKLVGMYIEVTTGRQP